MSKNIKALVVLVVIVILIIIGVAIWGRGAPSSTETSTQTTSGTVDNSLTTAPTDSSNAALQADVSSIDVQMNNLDSDLSATTTQVTQY